MISLRSLFRLAKPFIPQREKTDCGVAATAMAAGATYEEALYAIFPSDYVGKAHVVRMSWATSGPELRDALRRLGKAPGSNLVPCTSWGKVKTPSLVLLNAGRTTRTHWVFFHRHNGHETVCDPQYSEPMALDEYPWLPQWYLLSHEVLTPVPVKS